MKRISDTTVRFLQYHQEHINESKSFTDLGISYVYCHWGELCSSIINSLKEYLDSKHSILLPSEVPQIIY